jgi:hypothetical protein
MALASSMTLPPPTARMPSTFASRASAMPPRTWEMRGLGSTPAHSVHVTPAALSEAATASYTPFFLMLALP